MKDLNITHWYQNKTVKTVLIVVAVLAVIGLVFFSEQIGQLLDLFGIKAAVPGQETGSITLVERDGEGNYGIPSAYLFGTNGIFDGIEVDAGGRLVLKAPAD